MDMNRSMSGLGIEMLNTSNYKVWRNCMESYLVGEGLWDVVEGSDVQIHDAENSDAMRKWKQLNAKAEFALKRSISINLFDNIMGCKSAHWIWRALDGLFGEGNDGDESAVSGDVRRSRDLYNATVKGDWKAAEGIFQEDCNAVSERITLKGETALHVAIDFGHGEFVQKLVALMPKESLAIREHRWGYTALHYAVVSGNLSTVKALVNRHLELTQLVDEAGLPPLHYGAYVFKSKEILWYLTLKIPHQIPFEANPLFWGIRGGVLMQCLVSSHCYDICLHLLEIYPFLSIAKGKGANGMLPALICNPFDFQSGSKLSFWERYIYQFISIESCHKQQHSFSMSDLEDPRAQPPPTLLQSIVAFLRQVHRIKRIRDEKYNNYCTKKMVEIACQQISCWSEEEIANFFFEEPSILESATSHGIVELVSTCLQYFPFLIHTGDIDILKKVISNRKEKVFSLFLGVRGIANHVAGMYWKSTNDNILHIVARLAPYPQLSPVSCPALQMQRELQWYKAVDNLVCPIQRTERNKENDLPHEIFTNQHRGLLKDAEKWMKTTSSSCMVASTLIATVVFAAAFTVPGGNVGSKGIPLFLEEKVFMLFAISDALALFSSITSMLMFLSILTARYAEEDFLRALPKRLILGFTSLFIAIATMMVAFGATLYMILSERFKWIFIPIIAMTSIPVALFVMLQLPLCIFMVKSTYGYEIFHPVQIW